MRKVKKVLVALLAIFCMCMSMVVFTSCNIRTTLNCGGLNVMITPISKNTCPDFTVNTYKIENGEFVSGGEQFTLSDYRGKIVVINFWATYCGPCKAELPEFNEIQKAYNKDVVVITLNGEVSYSEEALATWLNTNKDSEGWEEFSIQFGRYEEANNNLYTTLGFSSGALPVTLIVDKRGKVVFKKEGSMHYDDLEKELLPFI